MALRDNLPEPGLENINVGAFAGAVVGSIGGLLAVGIPPAIVFRSLQAMFSTPKIAIICFFISGLLGLIIGGILGNLMRTRSGNPITHFIAGAIGGLFPVIMVLIWSYRMVTTY